MRQALSLTFALLLSACGPGSPPAASSSPSAPASTPASTAPSTAAKPAASAKPGTARSASAKPAASSGGRAQVTSLKVSYAAIVGQELPVWAAHDAGIFQKNGLEVEPVYIQSVKGIAALLAGETQAADIGGSDTLGAVAGGADLVTVAVDAPTYPFVLMARTNLKSVSDLKGKKIGVSSPGSASDTATRLALQKKGLDPDKDVKILYVGSATDRITALLNGSLDAGLSFPPNTAKLEKQGFHVVLDMASLHLPAVLSSTVLQRSYAEAHHDIVQKYVDSLVQAIAWAKHNKPEAVKVLETYYKNNDDTLMSQAYDFYMNNIIPALPYPRPELYANDVTVLTKKNAAVKNVDLSQMLDPSFVKSAADRGLNK